MADISLVNVCKTYKGGQNAVKDFNLDIKDRELIICKRQIRTCSEIFGVLL